MSKKREHWGDRPDGVLLRELDSLHYITGILYPNRCDNEAFISERIDLTNANAFLEKKNAENPEYHYNLFQLIVTAMVKTITLRPKMNRFIVNSNFYQRKEVSAAFVVKKLFADNGAEALAFLHTKETDTLDTIHQYIYEQVSECRSEKTDSSTDAMDLLNRIPRVVSKTAVKGIMWLDKHGRVDIPYMAELVGCEPEQVISELGTEIFRNPAKIKDDEPFSGYEDASEYLSGNVREKLKIAQDYAKLIDQSFERNVTALQSVIPKDLEADEISVRIGANWIEVEDYNRFFREVCKGDTFFHPVTRTKFGEYKIDGLYQDKSVAATETFGTPRMSSYHIFENLLNQRDIVVRDRVDDEDGKFHYEVNAKETQLAKEKARQMKEAFKSWVWEDIDRRDKYVEKYN